MNKKLSELSAPAIAGVVKERGIKSAVAEIKNCQCNGADMIDLHLSCLEGVDGEGLKKIIESTRLPILALNYNSTYENQHAGFDEEARVESMLQAVRAGAAGIDMQGYTYHLPSKTRFCGDDVYSFTKNNPREIVTDPAIIAKQCALIEEVHGMGAEVLLSCHPGIAMPSDAVVDLAAFLEKRNPDIIKIVTVAHTDEDLIECFRAMTVLKKEIRTPVSYHASGKAGMLSRIVNPLLGGQIVFCNDRYNEASTMEQLHLRMSCEAIDCIKKMI